MGDRCNWGFKSGDHTIFLYGHWEGHEMMNKLAHAIDSARSRWDDPAYATRIAITYLVDQDRSSLTETGWGLSVDSLSDNEHKVPVVSWDTRYSSFGDDNKGSVSLYTEHDAITQKSPIYTMSLEIFVKKFSKIKV